VGGQTNLLIAAARLGMRAAAVGHVGADAAGAFLAGVLADEGVELVSPLDSAAAAALPPGAGATLLCFVLVAPEEGAHAFCSAYDFGPWPLLGFLRGLPPRAAAALDGAAALFVNGFVFDELPAEAVLAAAARARARGAAVFFDPGPRAWTFSSGPRAAALAAMLDASDVVLMTEEEAEAVTGVAGAEAAARAVLTRPGAATRWCVVKRGACGALLAVREEKTTHGGGGEHALFEEAAIPVTVRDTVGCGDSYAAAVVLGYTRRLPIPATLALAAAVGAATATGAGAGRNVARAADVAALLEGAAAEGGSTQHADALDVLRASLAAAEPR
jgi:sugar/nucleoside kinase (ribokinase family)